jgi:aminopeptidase N
MKLLAALAAAVLALAAPALAAPAKPKPAAAPARIVLPTDVRPERYDIRVRLDPNEKTFGGEEKVAISVLRPTNRIVLNAADIKFDKVSLSGVAEAPRIQMDDAQQTAAFVFSRPLKPGRYTLAIRYAGEVYEQASGLFALTYDTAQGKRRALFTQFENSDARRFAPMWDEPGVKAVFALTVDAPRELMAVSNMPAAESNVTAPEHLEPRRITRFADSPKMSSYLLFVALGDFERIHRQVGATDVGVVVRKGDAAKAEYALDAAAKLLPFYNDYFGVPYPLPKLDLVAGPGRSQFFAAMENWGAIFYFDYAVLLDPKLSSEADRQNVFVTIAHEMAHQWFGDLVTMAWWDDLWLNEGFASWMGNKATDHFHPEWKVWLQAKAGQQNAMRVDARAGTHPIITPIPDVFAAASAFDGITYSKGEAVIRMLEDYVGEDVFRTGVRNYIAKHSYANTVTDDLWREIDRVSPRPITGIAHDFTLQAGVPLIRVERTDTGIRLTQSRFAADAGQQAPRSWRTPVTVRNIGEPWRTVVSARAPAEHGAAPRTAPLINAGQAGYFRADYSDELWARATQGFVDAPPIDQLGLIYDSLALGEAGVAPMTRFMDLAQAISPAADAVVQQTMAEQLESLDAYYAGQPGQGAFRAFARTRLAPLFAKVGWDARSDESDNEVILRGVLIRVLGELDDPAVTAEARRRFEAALRDPATLTGSTRQAVLQVVAGHADAAVWDQLHTLAKESTDPSDRTRLYANLGRSHDPALADRALALALSGEPPATDAPGILAAVADVFPEKAFAFALAHRAQVDALIEPTSRTTFYTRLATASHDPATPARLADFARTVPPSTKGEVDKAVGAIQSRLALIRDRLPDVDRWLKSRAG